MPRHVSAALAAAASGAGACAGCAGGCGAWAGAPLLPTHAHRHLRTRPHLPPHLAHRALLAPVHVLHAAVGRGADAVGGAAHPRRDGTPRDPLRHLRRHQDPPHRRRTHSPPRSARAARFALGVTSVGPRVLVHDEQWSVTLAEPRSAQRCRPRQAQPLSRYAQERTLQRDHAEGRAPKGETKNKQKTHVFQSLPKCRTPTFAICPKLNSNLGKGEQKTLVFQSLPKCRTPTFAICPELNSNLGRPFLCIETMENFPHSNALFLPYVAPPPHFPPI